MDTSGCSTCAAGSAAVGACKGLPAAGVFSILSIAAKANGMALAWLEETGGVSPRVGFALLSSSLAVTFSGKIVDAAVAAAPSADPLTAQIAALPSGWSVLATTSRSSSLYTLDDAGNVVAHNVLDPITGGYVPTMVSQPNGGPLLIWDGADATHAAVVSADGRSVSTPIVVPVASYDGSGSLPGVGSAAFAAGAFQVLMVVNCSLGTCLEIVSITPGGTIAGSFQVPNVTAPWGGRLVSGADDLRLFYETDCGTTLSDPCLKWLRMSPTGAVLTSPVLLDGSSSSALPDSAVAAGADSYLASAGPYWSLMLVRLSSDGAMVGAVRPIAQGGAAGAAMVRLGTDLVAGWVTNTETMELARLAP